MCSCKALKVFACYFFLCIISVNRTLTKTCFILLQSYIIQGYKLTDGIIVGVNMFTCFLRILLQFLLSQRFSKY